jgi:hypothetical protein
MTMFDRWHAEEYGVDTSDNSIADPLRHAFDAGMAVHYRIDEKYHNGWDSAGTAVMVMDRMITLAIRCALSDGVDPETIAMSLQNAAHAIEVPGDVAEDMSPISVPMN